MTLIVSRVGFDFVNQVADRLVSVPGRGAFDEVSNKTVVYVARSGPVSIAYAGAAYVGEVPTDQWIADCIRSSNYPMIGRQWAFSGERLPRWWSAGELSQELLSRLNGVFATSQDRKLPLHLMMVGWSLTRTRRFLPFLWVISNEDDSGNVGQFA